MYVRGPGVEEGKHTSAVTTHTDVSSTIARIAGLQRDTDGSPMPLQASDFANGGYVEREHASIEYWGPVWRFGSPSPGATLC